MSNHRRPGAPRRRGAPSFSKFVALSVIALNKGLHSLFFGLVAAFLIVLDLKLPILQSESGALLRRAENLVKRLLEWHAT